MKKFAIIPALNEFEHLAKVIEMTQAYVDHVVVVDDGSRQPLTDKLPPFDRLSVLRHQVNLGKGAALKTGCQFAIRAGAEALVFLDADGQHDPAEIPALMTPLENGTAEIAFGVRMFHQTMPFVARMGNIFLTQMLTRLYRIHVTDTQSGYRAFLASVYPKLEWESPRYAVETEMIVNTGKHRLRWAEVPIQTIYLDQYRGTTVLDGMRIFINMIRWRIL